MLPKRLASWHSFLHRAVARPRFAAIALLTVTTALACNAKGQSESMAEQGTPVPAKFKVMAVGDAAPLYDALTLAGDSVHVGRANQPVTVMNVWATWCVSCREEMQDLQQLQNDYKAKGVRVLGVSVDEADVARVQKFVKREALAFDMVHDQEGRVQQLYQVSGIPNTFIIGKDGRILWKSIGNLHGMVDSLKRVLDEAAR
ncbi:MAG: TlpA disulfide reductase family protein [Gemmatimonadaceae bacterium]